MTTATATRPDPQVRDALVAKFRDPAGDATTSAGPTPFDRLASAAAALCERIEALRGVARSATFAWAFVRWNEAQFAAMVQEPRATVRQLEDQDRRLDRAHRRHLAVLRTLAVVRKLAVPTVQVNVGRNQVNVASALPDGSGGAVISRRRLPERPGGPLRGSRGPGRRRVHPGRRSLLDLSNREVIGLAQESAGRRKTIREEYLCFESQKRPLGETRQANLLVVQGEKRTSDASVKTPRRAGYTVQRLRRRGGPTPWTVVMPPQFPAMAG